MAELSEDEHHAAVRLLTRMKENLAAALNDSGREQRTENGRG